MNRAWAPPLAAGLVAIGLGGLWAWLAGESAIAPYLAAWLFGASVPLGALVMLLVLRVGGGTLAAAALPDLRRLAAAAPLACLLFVPVLFNIAALYPWAHGEGPGAPLGDAWMHQAQFIGRAVIYLVLVSLLALLFTLPRPTDRHRGTALLGLFVLVLVLTLAAIDWFMSLTPSLHSGEFGLLIIGLQCATATAALVPSLPREAARAGAWLLAATAGAWLYLHFMHYLVIWSGDLPREAAWYLARDAGAGRTVEWIVVVGGFALPVGLLALPIALRAAALPAVALLALLAHMLEAPWFVTPSLRGHFALRAPDALMLAGFALLASALALALRPSRAARGRTAPLPGERLA